MIFQDPMMTLNPVLRCRHADDRGVQAHQRCPAAQARAARRDALERVGIPSPTSG
jgi:peptide/nickel transport system ATP-binding protein